MQTAAELSATYAPILERCNQLIIHGRNLYDTAFGLFKDPLDSRETARKEFEDTWPEFFVRSDFISRSERAVWHVVCHAHESDPRAVVVCATRFEAMLNDTIKVLSMETSRMLSGLKNRTAENPTGLGYNNMRILRSNSVYFN